VLGKRTPQQRDVSLAKLIILNLFKITFHTG